MAYENLCMYCFEDMEGQTSCPHCGRDSRAAVPQIQILPGSMVYHDRFLIGRALGQDASGIVYAAFDTKKENRLRIREYLPRDCAERLNDGTVAPIAGMEDQFDAGLRKLRASVEGVEDPRKRHFFFEENGTAYIAQRKSASAAAAAESAEDEDDEDDRGNGGRVLMFAGIAVAVLVVAAVLLITVFNGAVSTSRDITQNPTLDPSQVWIPEVTPTPTPYVAPTFAALVDPELSWMEYTYEGDVEQEYQQAQAASRTPTPTPRVTPRPTATANAGASGYKLVNAGSSASQIRTLQRRLAELGWLSESQVNGRYDTATRQAVKAFQSYVNQTYDPSEPLSVDGAAGPKTQQWLYEYEAEKPTPTPKPRVTPKPDDGTVDENASASQVRAAQRQLIALGLLPEGSADGNYGASTASAVRRFQQRVNQLTGYDVLPVTGTLDAQSKAFLDYYADEWENLRSATAKPTATPRPTAAPTATPTTRPVETLSGVINGDSPAQAVGKVQQLLVQIGMLPAGGVDGVYGSGTISAVADFQQWVNDQRNEQTLAVNGEVDQMTLAYLQYCVDHGMKPRGTPTPAPTETPTPAPTQPPEEDEPVEDEPEVPEGSQEINVGADSDPASISFVQEMLGAVGVLGDHSDGVYDDATQAAVRRFQEWVNRVQGSDVLAVTGQVDDNTRKALEYAYDHELHADDADEAPAGTDGADEDRGVGAIGDVQISVDGAAAGGDVVSVSEGTFRVNWSVDGDVDSYIVYVLDSMGSPIAEREGVTDTSFTVNTDQMTPGEVYTLRLGVLPARGGEDDIAWAEARFMLPEREAPEPEPEPAVASVSAPDITIAGQSAGGDAIAIEDDSFRISWAADGDVDSYYVRITDGDGNDIAEPQRMTQTSVSLRSGNMEEGMVYTLTVGAIPAGGTDADMVTSQARFIRPVQATPEPTEEPRAAQVGKPVINIGGSAYQRDGISVMTDSSIIISWSAEGDVESYNVYVENQSGERQSLGTTTDTSKTVSTGSLPAGVYTVYVGALPVGGGEDDIQWASARFGIPAPTEAPAEVPAPQQGEWDAPEGDGDFGDYEGESEGEPAVGAAAMSVDGAIDASTDADTIQQLQMRLYGMGLLSPDGLEAGVLDARTLQAVAEFQTRWNEQYQAGFEVIDPGDLSTKIDAATVRAIFAG